MHEGVDARGCGCERSYNLGVRDILPRRCASCHVLTEIEELEPPTSAFAAASSTSSCRLCVPSDRRRFFEIY